MVAKLQQIPYCNCVS